MENTLVNGMIFWAVERGFDAVKSCPQGHLGAFLLIHTDNEVLFAKKCQLSEAEYLVCGVFDLYTPDGETLDQHFDRVVDTYAQNTVWAI